jgi:CHAT domain-containing protein
MLSGAQKASGAQQRGLGGDQSGSGRGRDINRSHPFYWAAFIQSGAWQSMSQVASDK